MPKSIDGIYLEMVALMPDIDMFEYMNSDLGSKWYQGLPVRLINALTDAGFNSRASVKLAVDNNILLIDVSSKKNNKRIDAFILPNVSMNSYKILVDWVKEQVNC